MTGRDTWLDAVRQVVGDKPLFLIAGATDLVNEKLRQLPDALNSLQEDSRDFPFRAASVIVGQAFRANLKVGELYDDLARRGEHVVARMQGEPDYAEEDEPFVRQPYLPEPVHPAPPPVPVEAVVKPPVTKAAPRKTAASAKKPEAAKKGASAARRRPAKKANAARKAGPRPQ